jgi:hypothetical protein
MEIFGIDDVEVKFTHPRNSKQFIAVVGLAITGQQAIQGLIAGDKEGPFLSPPQPGRPYELVLARTKKQIAPNETFGRAGVQDQDVIEVYQQGQGY